MKKFLVYGDDHEKMIEVAKLIRADKSKAHLRSIRHWQGEVEPCDGIALIPVDKTGEEIAGRIADAYGKDKVVGPEDFKKLELTIKLDATDAIKKIDEAKAAADKAAADKAAADKAAADKAAADKAAQGGAKS